MIKKIKYVLNNENAGPNLESLLAISLSLIMVCAARWFASGRGWFLKQNEDIKGGQGAGTDSVYSWIRNIQKDEGTILSKKTN